MRGASSVAQGAVGAIAVACLIAFATPVVNDMNDGRMSFAAGGADASAAMVYILTVPVLLSLFQSALVRLVAVGVAVALGLIARVWVELVHSGHLVPAFLITGALLAALLGGAAAKSRHDARQRAAVDGLARACADAARGVTAALRQRWSAAPVGPDGEHPRALVTLADRLIAGAIATAATEPTPRDFAVALMAALSEIVDGAAEAGKEDDARGYMPLIVRDYVSCLRAVVARRVRHAPRLSATRRPAPA